MNTEREALIENVDYKILTKAGSCRSGHDRTGEIAHAVLRTGKAICGTAPTGRSAGWSSWETSKVTCAKCIVKLNMRGANHEL